MAENGASGRLTTHVLDTMAGRPAAGVPIMLCRLDGQTAVPLLTAETNADGRCEPPLRQGADMAVGTYELIFRVADYFRGRGVALADPPFLDEVPIRFAIADPNGHYHVPLLISPYAYSTYRGS